MGLNDDEGCCGEDHGGNHAHMTGMLKDDYAARGKRKSDNRTARRSGGKGMKGIVRETNLEMKEMWNTIAGGDSERSSYIRLGIGSDRSLTGTWMIKRLLRIWMIITSLMTVAWILRTGFESDIAEEGEEDQEIEEIFEMAKKKKRGEKSAEDIALQVENMMAELEVVAEVDADLNIKGKPATTKLKELSFLVDCLSKKHLQQEFLDRGVLCLLRSWLDPLPDGSLPNINVREAVLKILNDLPIDLEQYARMEQLKKSGLGKVIMFLSKSDEEITSSRKLAQQLVDKWSRPIFNKSTRFEDMKKFDYERALRNPSAKKSMSRATEIASRDDKIHLAKVSQEPKPGWSFSRQHALRPEPMSMDFVVRPQSKVDPDEVRARAKQVVQDQRRVKINKKLQRLKAPKRKQLQATKPSAEGRGMVTYV